MPVFDTGYFMQQDHIQPFVTKQKHEDEDTTLALVGDIGTRWLGLPCDIPKKRHFWDVRPPPLCLVHN